ncbi:MupG family TIM beta-alpha barrel fold protein [Ligilactobacillus sp. Marseille-Q7487]|jgi:hypothetical protein|uniref:DUF871 domain-containing protein n=1 Tax=Ligilactobacillus sp. Marseille-Q7487 TaxID=3022128 RepID=UPI0015B4E2C9|nr:MupG family TIM beta-alpha barrel fold protein [Ligilactobacillus sp. Marseille-Q7487]
MQTKTLGISIYPSQSDFEQDKLYLQKAHKLGYTRIFTSLLEINDDSDVDKYRQIIEYGNQLGFKTVIDVNPGLFDKLKIDYDDLIFFKNLGVYGLRLDVGFTGAEEARMTRNQYGLVIEINMSAGTNYLDNIMSYHPKTDKLWGCHNFYPQRYTALGEDFFIECSQKYRHFNINTAAFVTSPDAKMGPWPVQEGLPTLEADRDLPIATQVRRMLATDLIDDILIGNAYATDEELAAVAEVFFEPHPTIQVQLVDDVTELETKIVLEQIHTYRGDSSDYFVRDSFSRVTYKDEPMPAHHNDVTIKRGDIMILNEAYGQYKNEVQIALVDMPNDGKRNVVGHVVEHELFLLDQLQRRITFKCVK